MRDQRRPEHSYDYAHLNNLPQLKRCAKVDIVIIRTANGIFGPYSDAEADAFLSVSEGEKVTISFEASQLAQPFSRFSAVLTGIDSEPVLQQSPRKISVAS